MKFFKIKHKGGHTTIRYGEGDESVYTLESYDPPLPELDAALQALAPDVAEICELKEGAAESITVLGVTITDSEDTERATISATQKLKSGATMCLNTPLMPYTSDHGASLSSATIDRIETLCREAGRFVEGERAQSELPLDAVSDACKPIEDWIEGMKEQGIEVKVERNVRLSV